MPLLAGVVLVIAAGEMHGVLGALAELAHVAVLFVTYLAMPAVAIVISKIFGLRGAPVRTVIFSLGTRNSFVVLPLSNLGG